MVTLWDTNNKIILRVEAKLKKWKEYIEELFDDNKPSTLPQTDENINETGP